MGGFSGIVLCGGKSSRMGRPKADLPFAGEPLLVRVVRAVREVASEVVVVAAVGQELPALPIGVRVVRDPLPERGPLQGLAAGLAAVTSEVAFVAACDLPFLTPAFVRKVVDRLGEFDACVPEADGRRHPLAAAYRVSVREIAEGLLASDRRRMTDLLDAVRTRYLTDVDPEPLRNVNTPDEYAAAVKPLAASREATSGSPSG